MPSSISNSTQSSPTASCCARATTSRTGSSSRCWKAWPITRRGGGTRAGAVPGRAGGLLLYAPVVRTEDFHSAIAYLVRRLDENTAPENFLRHVFDLEPGSPEWIAERERF